MPSMEMVGRSQVWVEQLKLPHILVDSSSLLAMLGIELMALDAVDRLSSPELCSQSSIVRLSSLSQELKLNHSPFTRATDSPSPHTSLWSNLRVRRRHRVAVLRMRINPLREMQPKEETSKHFCYDRRQTVEFLQVLSIRICWLSLAAGEHPGKC